MAIAKKPPVHKADKIDKFIINEASDGKKASRFKKGNKTQITVAIANDLLDQVDAMAERLGISRAALITIALRQFVKSGLNWQDA